MTVGALRKSFGTLPGAGGPRGLVSPMTVGALSKSLVVLAEDAKTGGGASTGSG
jgi:hypothetical protein